MFAPVILAALVIVIARVIVIAPRGPARFTPTDSASPRLRTSLRVSRDAQPAPVALPVCTWHIRLARCRMRTGRASEHNCSQTRLLWPYKLLIGVFLTSACGDEDSPKDMKAPVTRTVEGSPAPTQAAGSSGVNNGVRTPSPVPIGTAGTSGGLAGSAPVPPVAAPAPIPMPGAMPRPMMAPTPVPMPMPMMPPPRMPGMGTCLQGSGKYDADGPYRVGMMDVMLPGGLGPYTIFHPTELEADCKHPIVAWGNGTGVTGSATYAAYHRRAASWGIVTIAAHNSNAGSMKFLEGGLDYLIAQNKEAGSMFFGKLSERAGVGGHSQGGIAATTATAHPNVVAEVCVQGGGFGVPSRVAFLCQTGVDDFLRGMCTSTYNSAAGPSFLLDHQMADHISTPTFGLTTSEPGKQYVTTSTAWYRCWLADDETACALFKGGMGAPVCMGSDWATCSSRNL